MTSSFLFTIFYIVISACLIYPQQEFVSAGLTFQSLFSDWLGSENENFIQYHIRKTVVNIICHSLLPFGYLVGLHVMGYSTILSLFTEGGTLWQLFTYSAVLFPVLSSYYVWCWWQNQWKSHPIAKTLARFCNSSENWLSMASNINIEFRRIDKICIDTNPVTKIIATDNWIMKITPYWINIARQDESALILCSSDTHQLAPNSPGGAQFLNIEVKSTVPGVKPFFIRLNAMDFRDLQDKVSRPITVLQNITFHRTLVDRFLDAFRQQVASNPVYETSQEMELCIGCMHTPSNVKLQKMCEDETMQGERCAPCHCQPMWCVDCMGKWFASRQDQNQPETWLSSKCTCPLCRSRFCMLDVCLVQRT